VAAAGVSAEYVTDAAQARAAHDANCPPPPKTPPLVQDLVGLALSGGGIRSASFNLGLLQGLASRQVLWLFDYLSTVSGGGFIGAWWSAWLSRKRRFPRHFPRPEELEPQRRRTTAVLLDRSGTASAVPSLPDGSRIARRDDPIHFVRLFSNYLTPKTGAFSPDTWRMIAFFLRSLMFTWAALLPLALAAMIAAQTTFLGGGDAAAFLCAPLSGCEDTVRTTMARIAIPLQWVFAAAGTFALIWLAYSSAIVLLAFVGMALLAIVGFVVLGEVGAGPGLSLHRGVWVVVLTCTALHVVNSFLQFERSSATDPTARSVHSTSADNRAWLTQQLAWVLKWGTFVAVLLVFAGFGHIALAFIVDRLKDFAAHPVGFAGGAGGLLAALTSVLYTVVKAAPSPAGTVAKPPGKWGRLLILLAPPLALIALALCLAMGSHYLLRASIHLDPGDDGNRQILSVLAMGAATFAALEVMLAIFESRNDPSTPPVEGKITWRTFVPKHLLDAFERRGSPAGSGKGWLYFFSPRGWVRFTWVLMIGALWLVGRVTHTAIPPVLAGRFDAPVAAAAGVLIASLAISFMHHKRNHALGSARPAGLLCIAMLSASLVILTRFTPMAGGEFAPILIASLWIALLIGAVIAIGWLADPNLLSMHGFYKARLTRAYLGASNALRKNEEITDAAPGDDIKMTAVWNHDDGAPYHLINTTLSLVGGSDLAMSQRSAENFVMSRYHCGSARAGFRCTADYMSGDLSLGTAAAISGAAVSPTMGSQTPSAALALLLSLFNVRLGFWAPTPSGRRWNEPHARLWPFYILRETLSNTGRMGTYCYLTDGGHFDNTGLYALVERGCRFIVISDCGADPGLGFSDIGVAIRRCRIDFGVEIELDVDAFRLRDPNGASSTHIVRGTVRYQREHLRMLHLDENKRDGVIVWVKPSVTALDAADVRQYRLAHDDFPQQPTSDQWYDESQFESYRRLGYESARAAFDPVNLVNPSAPPEAGDFTRVSEWFVSPR
jgi:hypothetical protein